MQVNNKIKQLRKESGLTLKEVAEHLGCSVATAQRYESENGIKQIPYDVIEKYAELFHVPPTSILGWDSVSQSNNCNASSNIGGEKNTYTTTNNYYSDTKSASRQVITKETKDHFFMLLDIVRNMNDKQLIDLIKYAKYLTSE